MWDAKQLNDILSGSPFEKDYSVSVQSSSGVITHNASSFKLDRLYGTVNGLSTPQTVREGNISWRILTKEFQSAQLWMVVAVPENNITKPVEDLMIYLTWLIIGSMFILFILGWILSYQLIRFINKLKIDTVHNSEQ
jgi:hypothetical protein